MIIDPQTKGREMRKVIHELKTWPEYFNLSYTNYKPFEIRKDNRDFKAGDTIYLKEWEPNKEEYTGRMYSRFLVEVLRGLPGVQEGYVVLLVEII